MTLLGYKSAVWVSEDKIGGLRCLDVCQALNGLSHAFLPCRLLVVSLDVRALACYHLQLRIATAAKVRLVTGSLSTEDKKRLDISIHVIAHIDYNMVSSPKPQRQNYIFHPFKSHSSLYAKKSHPYCHRPIYPLVASPQ
jgi:hypothetical protein